MTLCTVKSASLQITSYKDLKIVTVSDAQQLRSLQLWEATLIQYAQMSSQLQKPPNIRLVENCKYLGGTIQDGPNTSPAVHFKEMKLFWVQDVCVRHQELFIVDLFID